LVKAGFERHVLADTGNYWEGFKKADAEAPRGEAFFVFTGGLLERFCGARPVTEREVHWEVYTPRDSVKHWVQARWAWHADSVDVLTGISKGTGTKWVRQEEGRRGSDGSSAADVPVDTTVLNYKICADGEYVPDGKAIAAAMKTLQRTVWRPIAEGEGGWLFWLSDRPAPVSGYAHVWSYAPGKEKSVETRMEGVRVMKEIGGAPAGGVWRDGYGRGVLVKDGAHYKFYSRLSPEWGDLVWSGRFPVLLEELMVKQEEAGVRDSRVIDPREVAPVRVAGTEIRAEQFERTDLGPVIWGILVLLFVLERIMTFKNGDRKT
jgi:hypothetical protein